VDVLALTLVATIGILIGAVGIGGFLVVPVLVVLQGRPVREAVVAATVSFVGAGLVSLALVRRERGVVDATVRPFLVACAPGALAGALLLRVVDGRIVGLLITVTVGFAGVAQLRGWPRVEAHEKRARRSGTRGAFDGAIAGVASALTGTSGPLVAMPLLARAGLTIRARIRAAQLAQLPIALTATIVFVLAGDVGWRAAGTSALALATGVLVGMRITPRVAPDLLARTSAWLMLATACAMLASTLR
jgi:uncharacterized protein